MAQPIVGTQCGGPTHQGEVDEYGRNDLARHNGVVAAVITSGVAAVVTAVVAVVAVVTAVVAAVAAVTAAA